MKNSNKDTKSIHTCDDDCIFPIEINTAVESEQVEHETPSSYLEKAASSLETDAVNGYFVQVGRTPFKRRLHTIIQSAEERGRKAGLEEAIEVIESIRQHKREYFYPIHQLKKRLTNSNK